jgi:hypothetical protein
LIVTIKTEKKKGKKEEKKRKTRLTQDHSWGVRRLVSATTLVWVLLRGARVLLSFCFA